MCVTTIAPPLHFFSFCPLPTNLFTRPSRSLSCSCSEVSESHHSRPQSFPSFLSSFTLTPSPHHISISISISLPSLFSHCLLTLPDPLLAHSPPSSSESAPALLVIVLHRLRTLTQDILLPLFPSLTYYPLPLPQCPDLKSTATCQGLRS